MTHRILVVDDEPDITALVAYHLAKAGYRVSTATSGTEALKSAREERPDVVVLDLMLPGLSGYEVLAELRKRDETRDVGVILLTARREEPEPRFGGGFRLERRRERRLDFGRLGLGRGLGRRLLGRLRRGLGVEIYGALGVHAAHGTPGGLPKSTIVKISLTG